MQCSGVYATNLPQISLICDDNIQQCIQLVFCNYIDLIVYFCKIFVYSLLYTNYFKNYLFEKRGGDTGQDFVVLE